MRHEGPALNPSIDPRPVRMRLSSVENDKEAEGAAQVAEFPRLLLFLFVR